jgi:Lon protease-like protein
LGRNELILGVFFSGSVKSPPPATLDVPLFPLHTVLFPGGVLPLRVFEARYMDMTRECLKNKTPFGVCLIREGAEVGAPALPEAVGCLADIADCDMQQLGVLNIRTRGQQRFRIVGHEAGAQGLLRARVELIAAEPDTPVPGGLRACVSLLEVIVADNAKGLIAEPYRFEDAAWVGYRLSEIMPVPLAAKQKLMELEDSISRLEILHKFLSQRGLLKS